MNRYKYIDEKKEHLHTLDGQPLYGTSSVSNVLAKPLTWWASGLAVKELGIPDPKVITKIKNKKATVEEVKDCMASVVIKHEQIKQMTVEQFYKLLDSAYRAHQTSLKDKAEEGTDLHAELERFINDEMVAKNLPNEHYNARIQPFIVWARANIKRYLWSEGNCYSEKHWIGGISDVGFEDHKGCFAIMDFKSSKEAYLSQFWQCAGYALQILENGVVDKDGNTILAVNSLPEKFDYYAVLPFGMDYPFPQFNVDIAGSEEAFLAELCLYRKLPKD